MFRSTSNSGNSTCSIDRPSRFRIWIANLIIVAWLLLLVHQAAPFVPERLHKLDPINRVARRLGVSQGRWTMFAPEPDSQNQRITAVVTFADGSQANWSQPDWRSLGPVHRFLYPRDSKFIENIQSTVFSPIWPAFARRVAEEVSLRERRPVSVHRVELYFELSRIPPPDEEWRPWSEPAPVTERHLFHQEEMP